MAGFLKRLLVASVVLLSAGCATSEIHPSGPGVQIVFDGGAHAYVRDGRRVPGAGIGALPAAVADDPEALEIARRANRRKNVALGLALVGGACVGANLAAATTVGPHPSDTQQGVFFGTLICEVAALIALVPEENKAQADETDAVNLYNEHRALIRPGAAPLGRSQPSP